MSHWLPRWIIATIIFTNKQLVYVGAMWGVGKSNCIVKKKNYDSWTLVLKTPWMWSYMNLMKRSADPQADLGDVF